VLRDHALRRVLGLLRGVAGIEHDQLEPGAAQRLDAARGVDVLDPELRAHAHDLTGPRIDPGERHQQAHLDGVRAALGVTGGDAESEHRRERHHDQGYPAEEVASSHGHHCSLRFARPDAGLVFAHMPR
jgi:hypothetical protein